MSTTKPPLATAQNGVVSPLYFDRQVVRAEDLTLDRASHDAELTRMRRYLHGWGVVAGLIPTILPDGTLTVTKGYGITQTGAEIWLSGPMAVPGIRERIWACCGPGDVDCTLVDTEERAEREAEIEAVESVESWLILRPLATPSDPRPGIPAGCEHPAYSLLPTRSCDGLSLELLCALDPADRPPPPRCEDLRRLICGGEDGMAALLPMPEPGQTDDDFILLGKLTAGRESVVYEPLQRRTVLPVSLLQDWMTACLCPVLDRSEEESREPVGDDPPPADDGGGGTGGGGVIGVDPPGDLVIVDPIDPIIDPSEPIGPDWGRFRDILEANGFRRRRDGGPVIDIHVIGGDPVPTDIAVLGDDLDTTLLAENGIAGPGDFIGTPTAELAAITGLSETRIDTFKAEIGSFDVLLDNRRF